MPTILRMDDFTLEARIPGLLPADPANPGNSVVYDIVEEYVGRYEEEFAEKFFPDIEDYQSLLDYSQLPEHEQDDEEKNSNLSRLRFSISRYVAYWYNRNQTNTGIGTVELGSENGRRTDPTELLVKLWNDMVSCNTRLFRDMYGNDAKPAGDELFLRSNRYGI